MPETANLGLKLTDDTTISFSEWWKLINGDNGSSNKSNMQIIDDAIGNINKILDEINGEVV